MCAGNERSRHFTLALGLAIAPVCLGLTGCFSSENFRLPSVRGAGRPSGLALAAQNPADWPLPTPALPASRSVPNSRPAAAAPQSDGAKAPNLPPPPTDFGPGLSPPKNSAPLTAPSSAPAFQPPRDTLSTADAPETAMRDLYQQATKAFGPVDSYIARLRRREQVNGRNKPQEVILLKCRKNPFSIYFKWLDGEGKGREVTYVKGRYDNKIYTILAAGDLPLLPAGRRIALAADNPLVRANSRHDISEAGIGYLIARFGVLLEANEKGDHRLGTLKYLGPVKQAEFPAPLLAVEQFVPSGAEPQLPRGGRRLWMFDTTSHLPAVVITHDETGHEVENYIYDRIEYPVRLDDDDFHPDKLGA